MNNQHPITPPPDALVWLWCKKLSTGEIHFSPQDLATQAARWGADQELEACATYIARSGKYYLLSDNLICARRPKPPSLKEQALHELGDAYDKDKIDDTTFETIRKALEALDD